ncbi:ISL3 family transposase [Staphylococcus simiae]|uniref:ISL3 family transposase n=2 Tax=Staphylococcus simiae TaxID=308354 RepID=UPI000B94DBF5|nr:ISL3 family transposase [Staphylococcus simiae]SNV76718.1 transposase [Staphylococcus simiae]
MQNFISNTLNMEDQNIIYSEKLIKKHYKGKLCKFYYGTLRNNIDECPFCHTENTDNQIVKNGKKVSRITIPKVSECPAYLMLSKQRYLCRACRSYFTAKTPEINPYCHISNNTRLAVIEKAVDVRSEVSIARSCSVSTATVSRFIDQTADYLKQSPYASLPKHLMMDEFKSVKNVSGHMSFIFADAETHQIIDVVEDRRLQSLKNYFYRFSLKDRQQVETVTIDMHEPYMTLIKKLFPNAKIIIDRFHIVQLLNRALNSIRVAVMNVFKDLNKPLYNKYKRYWKLVLKPTEDLELYEYNKVPLFKEWKTQKGIVTYLLDQDDTLKETYEVINNLRHDLKHSQFNSFKQTIEQLKLSDLHPSLKTAIKTLKKHACFIEHTFNYINLTNGPIEGINNKIKLIKRTSFGYGNYNHLRNRILLCSKLYAPENKKEVKQQIAA